MNFSDLLRMTVWLAAGLALYAASAAVGADHPQAQVALWKAGNVTTFSFIGYRAARHTLGRLYVYSPPGDRIARAIVVAGAIVAGALGL